MLIKHIALVLGMSCLLPTWASEPGQPLDCSDWVFLEPGYYCTEYVSFCEGSPPTYEQCEYGFNGVEMDNTGAFYRVEMNIDDVGEACDGQIEDRVQLIRYNNNEAVVIGYVQDRCFSESGCYDRVRVEGANTDALLHTPRPAALRFDPTNGKMLISLRLSTIGCGYSSFRRVVEIGGFATLFEVIQTYTPNTSPLGFRVPYMPEGFQHADWFDTYYGSLATVGDWSQAQPMQCGYPTTAPAAGDYLTVQDTLPTPASGQGYYYVTGATHMGQTRYGRRSNGGVLTGRDPAELPDCQE